MSAGIRNTASNTLPSDPDTAKNDPDALIEVSLEDKGPHRFPQDCLKLLDEA